MKRPKDTNFAQQRLKTRPEKVTTFHLAVILTVFGIIFLPVGTSLLSLSNAIYEQTISYDDSESSRCYISKSNEGRNCSVTFDIDSNVDGPFYLYYQLENFYQNHRRYYQSRSILQLQGQDLSQGAVELDCNPLYLNDTQLLNPCGLIANSYFNDVFTLDAEASSPNTVVLEENNIAIPSDRNSLFKQVKGFVSAEVDGPDVSCEDSDPDMPADCKTYQDPSTGQWYKFYYPNDDTTQYLYETYPDQISPIDGVTDQHFIVWMRTEALPTFRKLYGKIPGNLNNGGGRFVVNITANFEVNSFKGKKSLVISNLGSFGGKNAFPGQVFITLGTFSLVFGLFLVAKEMGFIAMLKPRRD